MNLEKDSEGKRHEKKSINQPTFQQKKTNQKQVFVDNSFEAIEAKRLQEIADNSPDSLAMMEWVAGLNIEKTTKTTTSKAKNSNLPLHTKSPLFKQHHIIISWEVDGKTQTMIYTYEENRTLSEDIPPFVKNAIASLDQLYSTGASKIKKDGKEIDIIGAFMDNDEHSITIKDSKRSSYLKGRKKILWEDGSGIAFQKEQGRGFTRENTGFNSASSVLGHELIHGYNDEFDRENYEERRNNEYKATKENYHFTNEEERETTLNWANQINRKLGQDERTGYLRFNYNTESPTSVKPKSRNK